MRTAPAASAPSNGVLAIRVVRSAGPLDNTVSDRLSVAVPSTKWTYSKTRINAEHTTTNQLWDGPYPQAPGKDDWRVARQTIPVEAKDAYKRLLTAVNSPKLREIPADSDWKGVGDGQALISLSIADARLFPDQRTWENGATVPNAPALNWTVDAKHPPAAVRDVLDAAEALQQALHTRHVA
jgi:hypothetical protein